MGLFSPLARLSGRKSNQPVFMPSTPIGEALADVVSELKGLGFKELMYSPHGQYFLNVDIGTSKIYTLNGDRLHIGGSRKNGITELSTYSLMAEYIQSGNRSSLEGGGGWALVREKKPGIEEIVSVNMNSGVLDDPSRVKIEALASAKKGSSHDRSIESLGSFSLDALSEVTGRSIMDGMRVNFPSLFPVIVQFPQVTQG